MLESDVYKMLEDIEGSLIDIEMKSPRISIIEMENLRNYIARVKKEISRSFRRDPQDF
jgi:hypothetical protein